MLRSPWLGGKVPRCCGRALQRAASSVQHPRCPPTPGLYERSSQGSLSAFAGVLPTAAQQAAGAGPPQPTQPASYASTCRWQLCAHTQAGVEGAPSNAAEVATDAEAVAAAGELQAPGASASGQAPAPSRGPRGGGSVAGQEPALDWKVAAALAGASFEAYNELQERGLPERHACGADVYYLDR